MPEFSATVTLPWPKHPTLAAPEKAISSALMRGAGTCSPIMPKGTGDLQTLLGFRPP